MGIGPFGLPENSSCLPCCDWELLLTGYGVTMRLVCSELSRILGVKIQLRYTYKMCPLDQGDKVIVNSRWNGKWDTLENVCSKGSKVIFKVHDFDIAIPFVGFYSSDI